MLDCLERRGPRTSRRPTVSAERLLYALGQLFSRREELQNGDGRIKKWRSESPASSNHDDTANEMKSNFLIQTFSTPTSCLWLEKSQERNIRQEAFHALQNCPAEASGRISIPSRLVNSRSELDCLAINERQTFSNSVFSSPTTSDFFNNAFQDYPSLSLRRFSSRSPIFCLQERHPQHGRKKCH